MVSDFIIKIQFLCKDKTAGEIAIVENDYFDDSDSENIEIDSPVKFSHAWEYLSIPFLKLSSTILTVSSNDKKQRIVIKESFWGSHNQFSLIMRRDFDGTGETFYSSTLVICELDKPNNFHYLDITRCSEEGWGLKSHMAIKSSGKPDEEVFYFFPTEEERLKANDETY